MQGRCLKFSYSQDEASEEFIGEWMEQRGNRDRLVIATKVSYTPVLVIQYRC